MRKWMLFLFYVVVFAAYSSFIQFIVLYYQDLGFTGGQIGVLSGTIPLVTLVSVPLWTRLADASRKHRLIFNSAILVSVAVMVLLPTVKAFMPMLFLGVLFNFFMASVPPFADSATMYLLGDEKEMYGRIRLGGTIGYGIMALAAGILVENFGIQAAFWAAAGLYLVALILGQQFRFGGAELAEPETARAGSLLKEPFWIIFLTLAFASGLANVATGTFFFPFLRDVGVRESLMGATLMVGMFSEIPIMFFGNRLIRRFQPFGLLLLASLVSGTRLLLFAVSGTLIPIVIIQLLHGFGFPAMWLAGVALADQNAPDSLKTTAQGLFGMMVFGFGAAVGGFVGGVLLEGIGGPGLFGVFGAVVLGLSAAAGLISRRLPKKQAI